MSVFSVLFNTTNFSDRADRIALINGTVIELKRSHFKDSDLNELLYVVIVIMFYAIALMVLIATQVRKQRREGSEVEYYDEYLQLNKQFQKKQVINPNDIGIHNKQNSGHASIPEEKTQLSVVESTASTMDENIKETVT